MPPLAKVSRSCRTLRSKPPTGRLSPKSRYRTLVGVMRSSSDSTPGLADGFLRMVGIFQEEARRRSQIFHAVMIGPWAWEEGRWQSLGDQILSRSPNYSEDTVKNGGCQINQFLHF